MHRHAYITILLLLITFGALPAYSQQEGASTEPDPFLPPLRAEVEPRSPFSHELDLTYSYSGKSNLSQGERPLGSLDAMNNTLRYVASYPITDTINLRTGLAWDRWGFSLPPAQPTGSFLPNTLQSTALILGTDVDLDDNWVMRVEIEPGIYSDFNDITIDDFNIPATIGFSYLVDADLQWFFGILADPRSEFPVLPGIGVRWKFAEQWTLMLLLPKPRIEYQPIQNLTLFAGGELKSGGFQVSRSFGSHNYNRSDLDNDRIEYREIRTGGGLNWQIHPGVNLQLEGGYTIDRRFEYRQSDLILDTEGAPYAQTALNLSF